MKPYSRVYFVKRVEEPLVKIGFTTLPLPCRIASLRCVEEGDLELLAAMPGGRPEEQAVHQEFHDLHERGEWFRYEEPLKLRVEKIATQFPELLKERDPLALPEGIPLLTPGEVARLLRVSVSSVRRWGDVGALKVFRTKGGHRRYRPDDVCDFLDSLRNTRVEITFP